MFSLDCLNLLFEVFTSVCGLRQTLDGQARIVVRLAHIHVWMLRQLGFLLSNAYEILAFAMSQEDQVNQRLLACCVYHLIAI